jgi:hypothetical protein
VNHAVRRAGAHSDDIAGQPLSAANRRHISNCSLDWIYFCCDRFYKFAIVL